jgi:undecaprenyl-diphosphatase
VWGAREIFVVKVSSEYLVFVVIALSCAWLIYRVRQRHQALTHFENVLKDLILQGMTLLVIPVGVATAISEVISRFYIRQRPFVAMHQIKLLVSHSADGGMPSHHMVFMASAAFMIYISQRWLGLILIGLALISGVGRISAGIHYPSDVIAGILLAGITVFIYIKFMYRFSRSFPH